MKIVVNGAKTIEDVPGLFPVAGQVDVVIASDRRRLAEALPGADVLLGWDFQSRDMQGLWERADSLKWIHWCGAAVDRIAAPELTASDILLTNARGIFDDVMAEYILAYMLAESMRLRETFKLQEQRVWNPRIMSKLSGTTAVIFGVGSIGRTTARLLRSVGVKVFGVGRTERHSDPDFDEIFASRTEDPILSCADWVVGLMPLTPDTVNYFNAAFFAKMKPSARFLNLGRGEEVDEESLITALNQRQIAGAMLDVFWNEPLAHERAVWRAANIVISPHSSSYYAEYEEDMARQFLENLDRFTKGKTLKNVVDKSLGFVKSGT